MSTTTFEQSFRIPEALPERVQDVASQLGERSLAGSDIAPMTAASEVAAPVIAVAPTETALEAMLPERGTDGCLRWSADPHTMLAQVAAVRARRLQAEVVAEVTSDNTGDGIRYNADGIRIWPSSPHEIIAANQEALRRSRENAR